MIRDAHAYVNREWGFMWRHIHSDLVSVAFSC